MRISQCSIIPAEHVTYRFEPMHPTVFILVRVNIVFCLNLNAQSENPKIWVFALTCVQVDNLLRLMDAAHLLSCPGSSYYNRIFSSFEREHTETHCIASMQYYMRILNILTTSQAKEILPVLAFSIYVIVSYSLSIF